MLSERSTDELHPHRREQILVKLQDHNNVYKALGLILTHKTPIKDWLTIDNRREKEGECFIMR